MPEESLYTPLYTSESIRLIILEPGLDHEPVTIQLQTVESPSVCEYDAISYTWGDAAFTKQVICCDKPLSITESLHWALLRIRHRQQRAIVWADALCINQDDPRERSTQVGLMGSIFAGARTVFLCMGMDADGGALHVQSLVHELSPSLGEGAHVIQVNQSLANDARWHSMAAFTHLSWFKRAWVIQEAGLARNPTVLYGTAEFRYRDFIRLLRWLGTCEWSIKFGFSSLYIHLDWVDWTREPLHAQYTFLDLLSHGALLSCSDPRDRVYAFLGHPLARPDGRNLLITPNYEKDPDAVFLDVSRAFLRLVGLDSLAMVEHTESTMSESLPSWVTRWDVSAVMNDILRRPNVQYAASRGLCQDLSNALNGNELSLRGVVIDTVLASYSIDINNGSLLFRNTSGPEELDLKDMMEKLYRAQGFFSIYNDWAEPFSRTLCAYSGPSNATLHTCALKLAAALAQHIAAGAVGQKMSWNPDRETLRYGGQVDAFCQGRTFVVTPRGYYALAPRLTRPGDVAAVLYNVDVPFFLRPFGYGGRCRLLGESYVSGVMEGQVCLMLQRGELQEEVLTIC
jgi:hypothetical protein